MRSLLALLLLCAPAAPAWSRAGGGGGGGGGGCFAAGTLITTTAGDTIIEAIRPGDRVLAYNDDGLVEVPVKKFFKQKGRRLTITTKSGRVTATGEHPFLTRHGFVEAGTLKAGDEIGQLQDGRVAWVKITKLKPGPQTDVYNLEVAPPHTFIANGFVVHNKGGGGYSGSRGRGGSNVFFILFMAIVVMIMKAKERFLDAAPQEALFTRDRVALRASQTESILSALGASDPSVRPESLKHEVSEIFIAMQAAWEARDYSPLRERIAPELYSSHTSKVDAMLARGEKNMMDDVQVQAVDFVHVRYPDAQADRSVTALITASARDYTIDEGSGQLLRGGRATSTFQEFWTFRIVGGRWVPCRINQTTEEYILTAPNFPDSPPQAAAARRQAPPVPLNAAVAAAAAAMASAPQARAPQQPAPEKKPERGFDSAGDPWDRQRMEIAATLAFLSVYGAWEKGHTGELQQDDIFPETLDKLKGIMAERAAEDFKFEFGDLYTKKAEIVLTSPASRNRSGMDEFTARINASARRALSRAGKAVHRDAGPEPFTEYWVFARDAGKKWKFREILPRVRQEGGDLCQADVAPTPVQLEWYWRA